MIRIRTVCTSSSPAVRHVHAQIDAARVVAADQVAVTRKSHSRRTRMWIYQKDNGICCHCGEPVDRHCFEVSHYPRPLAMGGKDVDSNRHPAHPACHARWTAEVDQPAIARAKRKQKMHETGRGRKLKGRPMAGTRASGIRRRFSGKTEKR
ncbi:HNH endonuclease [Oricola sp.]|uniref:HNH endonuclease n=1 Tax=Oricola sp. TaxID=1979950 RepID=UPI003BAB8328